MLRFRLGQWDRSPIDATTKFQASLVAAALIAPEQLLAHGWCPLRRRPCHVQVGQHKCSQESPPRSKRCPLLHRRQRGGLHLQLNAAKPGSVVLQRGGEKAAHPHLRWGRRPRTQQLLRAELDVFRWHSRVGVLAPVDPRWQDKDGWLCHAVREPFRLSHNPRCWTHGAGIQARSGLRHAPILPERRGLSALPSRSKANNAFGFRLRLCVTLAEPETVSSGPLQESLLLFSVSRLWIDRNGNRCFHVKTLISAPSIGSGSDGAWLSHKIMPWIMRLRM
mmetsp:Transcript_144365/g.204139  ORF Transcript_144365/g.204139 Transcript_144365/m.204139 type:complete len:278 (+) Transcript_144365:946-1779(+)